MELLGHSQIHLTLNTYTHVVPALQREAAGRLEALLRPELDPGEGEAAEAQPTEGG
jgi:hypothetical protein